LDTEVLGVALLAGIGAGVYPNLSQAIGKAVRIAAVLPHDLQKAQLYDCYFEVFLELVNDMAARFSPLTRLTKTGDAFIGKN